MNWRKRAKKIHSTVTQTTVQKWSTSLKKSGKNLVLLFVQERALAPERTRFWIFMTPIWAPKNKASPWWKEHQHWATSALLSCYWRQLHSGFLTYCVAWHEMRQHSCQDFCFIIVSTQPCYEIHSCRAVFLCRLQNFSGHLKFLVFKDVYLGVFAVQIRYQTVM